MSRRFTIQRGEESGYLVAMLVIAVLSCSGLLGNAWSTHAHAWIYGFIPCLVSAILVWRIDLHFTHQIRNRYEGYTQITRRMLLLLTKQLVTVGMHYTICTAVLLTISQSTDIAAGITAKYWPVLAMIAGISLFNAGLWECDYLLKQWSKMNTEKDRYSSINLRTEFDVLKGQVNPHFLFNCFNTLSSLITEDRQQASRFLDELSKVYRYLLRMNDNSVSTLRNELNFIRSYFELLRTRHGDAIMLHIETDKNYDEYLLPSLSLQLLVENAVKHNALSKNHPLTIDIFTTVGNRLVVNNNTLPRSRKPVSGKVGLKNILDKYELLEQEGFQYMEDGKNFTVVLPLIWSRNLKAELSK